jgi:predicted ArsR family transcriptional regulator
MSAQLDAFAAYRAGTAAGCARRSDTSRAAAESLTDLPERQREVLDALRHLGPTTGERLGVYLDRETYTVLPRLTELQARGLVQDTGRRLRNRSGRAATVWALRAGGSLPPFNSPSPVTA